MGGTKERSGGQFVERGVTASTNVRKVFCKGGSHLQDPGTGMADEPARHLEQPPTHGGDAMPLPAFAEGRVFEEYEEVMGNDTDPEEGGIGTLLTARHALHAKADFELLDAVLGILAPLAVPDQHVGGTSGLIAGDDMVAGPFLFQQIRLMAGAHHDESKGLVRGLHAMHGLRHGTVRVAGPGGFGNRGDSHQGRGIQPAADGESPAGLFAVIEEIGLIAGRIRAAMAFR